RISHQTIGQTGPIVPRVRRLRRKRFRSRTRRRISGPRLQRPNRAVCLSRLNADLSSGAEPPPRARTRQTATISECWFSVVASPRSEPANLTRTESGEERLALHKNHEGRAQVARAMGDYGMTAVGAKRT